MSRGTIFKRTGSKTWTVNVDVGRDPTTGARKRDWFSGFATKRDAQQFLTETQSRIDKGTYVAPMRQTLQEFAEVEWLPAIRSTIRESTWESYAANLRAHVLRSLGGIQLQELTPAHLNRLYAELAVTGKKNARKKERSGLSPRTIRYVHTITRRMLRDAERWGRVTRNVADLADPPSQGNGRRRELRTWTNVELRAFLEHVAGDRFYAPLLLGATTGMRRGEVLGLRWSDVDLDAAQLSVRQSLVSSQSYEARFSEPKTDRGRRSIPLAPETVAVLRSWSAQQKRERLAWGSAWKDTGLVFTREDGSLVHPDRFSKVFDERVRSAGVPRIRLHDLRHTWATLALAGGVHPKVVSEILGHSSIAITLDIYSHAVPALQAEATAKVAQLVFGAGVEGGR